MGTELLRKIILFIQNSNIPFNKVSALLLSSLYIIIFRLKTLIANNKYLTPYASARSEFKYVKSNSYLILGPATSMDFIGSFYE